MCTYIYIYIYVEAVASRLEVIGTVFRLEAIAISTSKEDYVWFNIYIYYSYIYIYIYYIYTCVH